jgi:hypothetical protein
MRENAVSQFQHFTGRAQDPVTHVGMRRISSVPVPSACLPYSVSLQKCNLSDIVQMPDESQFAEFIFGEPYGRADLCGYFADPFRVLFFLGFFS